MTFINQITAEASIVDCLKKMDSIGQKLLVITEGKKFISVLSIGDIQRAIINNIDLNSRADSITRSIITVASTNDSIDSIRNQMMQLRTECMPVINDQGELENIIYWDEIIQNEPKSYEPLDCPVVIMAGGEGSRLRPLTNVIPKPLIPFGESTLIEGIIDRFAKHQCKDFFISVNYKAELIKYYLDSKLDKSLNIKYFEEEKPLGTAGSLFLLKDTIQTTFFVSNCDILVDQDYSEVLEYHRENKNELTVVSALKHVSIPYGTLETGESGILEKISEKPELTYMINSGLYILEPNLLDEIPENQFFHITSLINKLLEEKRRIGVFPVSEKRWKDVGDWKGYYKNIQTSE